MVSIERVEEITPQSVESFIYLIQFVAPTPGLQFAEAKQKLQQSVPVMSSFYLASIEQQYVGMTFVIHERGVLERYEKVESVAVAPIHQNKGVGRAMMLQLMEDAKQEAVEYLELTSAPIREAANHLYTSLGFELIAVAGKTNYYRWYPKGGFH